MMYDVRKLFKSKLFLLIFSAIVNFIAFNAFGTIQGLGFSLVLSILFGPFAAVGCLLALVACGGVSADVLELIMYTFMLVSCVVSWKLWYCLFNKKSGYEIPNLGSYMGFIKLTISCLPIILYSLILSLEFDILKFNEVLFSLSYFSLVFFMVYAVNYFNIPLYSPKKQFRQIMPLKLYDFALILSYLVGFLIVSDIIPVEFLFLIILLQVVYIFKPYDREVFKIKDAIYFNLINKVSFSVFIIFLLLEIVFGLLVYFRIYFSSSGHLDLYSALLIFDDSLIIFSFGFFIPLLIYIYFLEKNVVNPINKISSSLSSDVSDLNMIHLKNISSNLANDEVKELTDSLIKMEEDVIQYKNDIIKVTAEKEKYETELELADKIQSSMISTDFEEFCNGRNFEIWGLMKAAREVGGDFYDYFNIDDDNIGFVIGDVSGKGIVASLIMVKALTLIKDHLKYSGDVSWTFEQVNNLLCQGNVEELFVTCWLGKLNLKTGELTYVNAGHNFPLIKQGGHDFQYFKTDSNLVLAAMEDMAYTSQTIHLNHEDCIFLYTDGVTEANDDYNGFYGEDRLNNILNNHSEDDLSLIISSIKKDIDGYCNNHEQFDDITMLCLRYL